MTTGTRKGAKAPRLSGRVKGLDEVHLPVIDMARMRAFYRTELGFREAFSHADRMVAFDTGGAMLVLDATKARTGPTYLGFQAEGTAELISRLVSRGIRVVTPTARQHWGELLTCVEDPEGNVLALEEKAAAAHVHHHGTSRGRGAKRLAPRDGKPRR